MLGKDSIEATFKTFLYFCLVRASGGANLCSIFEVIPLPWELWTRTSACFVKSTCRVPTSGKIPECRVFLTAALLDVNLDLWYLKPIPRPQKYVN